MTVRTRYQCWAVFSPKQGRVQTCWQYSHLVAIDSAVLAVYKYIHHKRIVSILYKESGTAFVIFYVTSYHILANHSDSLAGPDGFRLQETVWSQPRDYHSDSNTIEQQLMISSLW